LVSIIIHIIHNSAGYVVAQLVEALRYKPEGRGFDSQLGHCFNLSGHIMALGSTQPLREMSTRNISWRWRQPVLNV